MPIAKATFEEHRKLNFHTVSWKDLEDPECKMCATCDYGTSMMGGTPAYCYKTGFRIDWDFVCNKYRKIKDGKNDRKAD